MARSTKKSRVGEKPPAPPEKTGDEKIEDEKPKDVPRLLRLLAQEVGAPTGLACSSAACTNEAVSVWTGGDLQEEELLACKTCQEVRFGGCSKGTEPSEDPEADTSRKSTNDDHGVKMNVEPGTDGHEPDGAEKEDVPEEQDDPEVSNANDNGDYGLKEEEEEAWDLKKIMSIAEINHECPIKCSHADCPLPAGVAWVSNRAPETKWYSCLDHQSDDFGGWPDLEELPLKYMSKDHMDTLLAKCSNRSNLEMPLFSEKAIPSDADGLNYSQVATPGPRPTLTKETDPSAVTPSPGQPLLASEATKAPKPKPVVSKKQLEMHRQWQETAVSMGGPNARIVVSKPEAKKLIFDVLHDAYAPMNINEIHKALKGAVPSPVLKQCLDDMILDKFDEESMFVESDDEDDVKANKKQPSKVSASVDPFAKTLSFKAAKSVNAALYYTDYKKLLNNGDGLEPEARNMLQSEHAKTKAELTLLQENAKEMTAQAAKLLSEPKNEELMSILDLGEADLATLEEPLEAARGLKANEELKLELKRHIEHMASYWRKRKRMTMDFLIHMEEHTEGVISSKKCLAGDGQIDIESDEVAVKNATAYYCSSQKRPATKRGAMSAQPVSTFVGVLLDAIGCVERVIIDESGK